MIVGDNMNIINMLIDFSWNCTDPNSPNYIGSIFHMIKTILDILRIVVPIALIAMTTLDITKKIINPDDKEGQKKIMTRAIGALIVFFVPTIISLTFKIIDWGTGKDVKTDVGLSACWR